MKGICYAERRNGSCGCFTVTIICWSAYTHDKRVTETRLVVLRARSRHVNRTAVSPQVLGFPDCFQLAFHRKPFKGNITSCQNPANTTSAATTLSWNFYLGFWRGTRSCSGLHSNLICIFYNICMEKWKQMLKGWDWLDKGESCTSTSICSSFRPPPARTGKSNSREKPWLSPWWR